MTNAHHPPLRLVEPLEAPEDKDTLARRQLIRGLHGIGRLTPRECELLGLMAEGMSNKGICERLMLSTKTVETHVGHVFDKLGLGPGPHVHRRVMATRIALTNTALRERAAASAAPDERRIRSAAL